MASHKRLKFDYELAMAMVDRNVVRSVTAYSHSSRTMPITSLESAWQAKYYVVEFGIRTLIERGSYTDTVSVGIDIDGCPDYPKNTPPCFVISKPMLWHPHVNKTTAKICIGKMGVGDFQPDEWSYTLAHLILHLARLINLDEPEPPDGYNVEALSYWKTTLNLQPITQGLDYPPLLAHMLYRTIPSPAEKTSQPKLLFQDLGRSPAN